MKFLCFWILSLLLASCASGVSIIKRIAVAKGYDPGSCKNETHGNEVLVKNIADEEKIVICVKDRGVYQWRSTDGSQNTVGEFFNPGYDCADILNKRQDAKDGFYWITLKLSNPKKMWCDMTTDGGGYILIGRMNTSVTWSLPSIDIPVEPFGEPHWSSSVGDAPVLDLRVQMATKNDFKSTIAHWSFKLQSTRPLKNLLTTTDGCDQRSAGIGNIAYVKDLQTERIVTTTLRCSKFGFAYLPASPFGWPKMNSCFAKSCPWGFAFLAIGSYRRQLDHYGAFSYSTTGSVSGMGNNATAFVGCDNQVCCACYGPVGGTKEYCAENCQAINGGTVTKNVFTWFWVRSSLPKRLWKKCMDYEVKRDDGKLIWYKLVGHNVIPIEGRCSMDAVLLHDGIVVVPDSKTAQKVVGIDGLLEYRKDKQELYIRSNKTWNVLAQKNEMDLKLVEFEKKVFKLMNFNNRQECSSYTLLDNKDRNIKYTGGGSVLCDGGISTGWYRFGGDAGTQLSTTCVDRTDGSNLKCRAHVVSWLNGTHPSVSDGKVTRTVCLSWIGNCCWSKKDIEVINCGFFYIYKLVSIRICSFRYCGTDV